MDKLVLDIREYITEKQGLYIVAREKNKDLIICHIYNRLDLTLALIISLRDSHNTINNFCFKVYLVEYKA